MMQMVSNNITSTKQLCIEVCAVLVISTELNQLFFFVSELKIYIALKN